MKFCTLNISGGTECNCTPVNTNLQKFQNHILKRRTRSVLFPNKANLLLTPAFTKAVLDGRPRGLSYSVEFDMYHPLPDTIEGWQPTILINKLKEQKPSTTKEKEISPNETVTNANYLPINILENNDHHLYDDYYEFPFNEIENLNNWNYFESEWDRASELFVRKLDNHQMRKSANTNLFHRKPSFVQKSSQSYAEKSNRNNNNKYTPDNLAREINWPYTHDHSIRERRQLLEQLETVGIIFRFNMKACIRRAMCEITNNLKPYGESLIEDIIRLILTIPSSTANDYDDMRYDNNKVI
ncbi:hypothetical protein DOY81_006259 [Sarcophaga bullata]|nr:hypothetical protein DOY81_006259 [Sarcophaga bullata]